METLFYLLAAHALCDFPLQGDYLSRGKNHKQPLPGTPWWLPLAAHALIHGGAVALVTGNVFLGVCETALHATIDYFKCDGKIGYVEDQAAHVACKLGWWAVIA